MRRLRDLSDLEAEVVAVVGERPGASSNAIARSVRARRKVTLRLLSVMAARGVLRAEERPGKVRAHFVARRR